MSDSVKKEWVRPRFWSVLLWALIAAVITAVVNNVYGTIYSAATGLRIPEVINLVSVTLASVMPVLVAGLGYFLLTRITRHSFIIFAVVVAVLGVLSVGGSFAPELPDGSPTPSGFAGLSAPMHFTGPLIAILLVPIASKQKAGGAT